MARYCVGIDLGTTNSVISFIALDSEDGRTQLLPIPQLVDMGTTEPRDELPSFLHVATQQEQSSGGLDLPWLSGAPFAVGELARRAVSAEQPDRTISAAKSWLCHHRVDRQAPILPWNAPDEVGKLSPVTATRRYLEHIRETWNQAHPEDELSEQRVVLTVPASFDPSARELTHQAAMSAGFPADLTLLEEPQAAVYHWLSCEGDNWRKRVQGGDVVLVCDVGGGTTDLTLVQAADEGGDLILRRLAVGNHLLVGGDNMDLALAHYVAGRFQEQSVNLDPWQSISLWHSRRDAKESLLGPAGKEEYSISVLGRGSKLIGGTVSVEVQKQEVQEYLLDGFFPRCKMSDSPQAATASGFREIGLPYEADTAITRHVAAFLMRQVDQEGEIRPTHLLFNGGVFRSDAIVERCQTVFSSWFGAKHTPTVLGSRQINHAVASGAAFYGWAKERGGIRIRGGTARSYYVGIESAGLAIPGASRPLQALCVVPQGMEEGTEFDVPSMEVGLVVGQRAQFRFFGSSQRKQDQPGDLLKSWESDVLCETDAMEALLDEVPGIEESYVPVRFQSRVTELGMLELWCVHGDQRWKLEFNVRGQE